MALSDYTEIIVANDSGGNLCLADIDVTIAKDGTFDLLTVADASKLVRAKSIKVAKEKNWIRFLNSSVDTDWPY